MAELLPQLVEGTARTYPLFDDGAGGLLEAMIREGRVTDPATVHAATVRTAGQVISRLPAFPNADMDVILDVRARLREPLVRFRAALATASAQMDCAAWDESFPREVNDLYARLVAPRVLEVEESLRELGAIPSLLRATSQKDGATAGALVLTAAIAEGLAALPAAVFAASGSAAVAAAQEVTARRQIRREAQTNEFYFLYEANRQLAGAGHR